MNKKHMRHLHLLAAGTVAIAALGSGAQAQDASAQPAARTPEGQSQGDIVVTATRRSETLSRVPLSVVAMSAEKMDVQGVRSIDDISRLTPGLQFNRSAGVTAGNASTISIRGISSGVGASTTGIYIDDTPIQSRAIGNTSSSAFPRVFDLERVEVLRGPQGTLFGAGAEGGAVRFITPTPSLTKTSIYTRSEVDATQGGAPSYEIGAGVGTPIIQDKLGLRIAAWYRHDGGYIDRVNPTTGAMLAKNANTTNSLVLSGSLLYQPFEGLKIIPSIYYQDENQAQRTQFWDSLSNPSTGTYRTGALAAEPVRDKFALPALKIEGDLGFATLISNTSYFNRTTSLAYDYTRFNLALFTGSPYSALTSADGYHVDMAYNTNTQKTFTQEVRLQSKGNGPFNWTIGGFYSHLRQEALQQTEGLGIDSILTATTGRSLLTRYGSPLYNGTVESYLDQIGRESQLSVFGEASYALTSKLKITAGGRYSHNIFDFETIRNGPIARGYSDVLGQQKDNPVTPKAGIAWQANPNNLFYFNAAKGYRIGGANVPVNTLCGPQLATIGYSASPSTYGADSLWSYEVGAKNSLFGGKLRLDGSAYQINWNNIQRSVSLSSCGSSFIANLGSATARGFDLSAQIRPVPAFLLTTAVSYNHNSLDKTIATGVASATPYFVQQGDPVGGPPWSATVSGQYDFTILSRRKSFARVDYQFKAKGYAQNPLVTGYDATLVPTPATHFVSARVGTAIDAWNISVFVDNLLNASPILARVHDTTASPLFYETTFRPRTFGLTVTSRY